MVIMAKKATNTEPTKEALEIIKHNQTAVESLETRDIFCFGCKHKISVSYQRTSEPTYVSLKCNKCNLIAPYNLADYRRGISLRNLFFHI